MSSVVCVQNSCSLIWPLIQRLRSYSPLLDISWCSNGIGAKGWIADMSNLYMVHLHILLPVVLVWFCSGCHIMTRIREAVAGMVPLKSLFSFIHKKIIHAWAKILEGRYRFPLLLKFSSSGWLCLVPSAWSVMACKTPASIGLIVTYRKHAY